MTHGLLIRNGSNQVVIDSELSGLVSVNRGTVIAGPVQASGSPTANSPGMTTGYSVVRIYVTGQFLIGIQLIADWYVSIISITYGSGYADITLNAGYGRDGNGFITTQAAPAVWAFAPPTSLYGGWGLALYNASGALRHDFSSPYLCYPRSFGTSVSQGGFRIASLSNPVIIGNSSSSQVQDAYVSGKTYKVIYQHTAWFRPSADPTLVQEFMVTTKQFGYIDISPRGYGSVDTSNSSAFIVEGNLLQ